MLLLDSFPEFQFNNIPLDTIPSDFILDSHHIDMLIRNFSYIFRNFFQDKRWTIAGQGWAPSDCHDHR